MYLFLASYTTDGVKGVLKEGAASRKATIEQVAKGMGGSLKDFYFAFGDADVYVIAELPDQESAIALSLAVNATGAVNVKTTVLLTVDEVDRAMKKTVNYRPPGA
jgi:uncharacterized protein with GYD domain